ncbi:unnamed protein product [Absidia cylindrospora]
MTSPFTLLLHQPLLNDSILLKIALSLDNPAFVSTQRALSLSLWSKSPCLLILVLPTPPYFQVLEWHSYIPHVFRLGQSYHLNSYLGRKIELLYYERFGSNGQQQQ